MAKQKVRLKLWEGIVCGAIFGGSLLGFLFVNIYLVAIGVVIGGLFGTLLPLLKIEHMLDFLKLAEE